MNSCIVFVEYFLAFNDINYISSANKIIMLR